MFPSAAGQGYADVMKLLLGLVDQRQKVRTAASL